MRPLVRGGTGQPQCASQCHPLQIARVRVHISSHKGTHRVSDSTTGTESSKTAVFLMANQRVFVSQYESFGVCAVAQETLQTDYKISSRLLGANQHSTFPFLVVHFYPAHLWDEQKEIQKKETCGADSHKQTSKDFERLFHEHVRSGKEAEKDLRRQQEADSKEAEIATF